MKCELREDGTLLVCKAETEVERLRTERDELREALDNIIQWAEAYPLDIFHEPTKEEYHNATELLRANGMTLDAFSASMGRHCLEGVARIAWTALQRLPAPPSPKQKDRDRNLPTAKDMRGILKAEGGE